MNTGSSRRADLALWAIIATLVLFNIWKVFDRGPTTAAISASIVVFLLSAFSIVHGVRQYRASRMFVFFLVAFGISWSYETTSILTGFPFGHYHYTDKLGPKLWLVPLLIMPAYFAVCYISWIVSHVLLGLTARSVKGAAIFVLPIIATFLMVMWDICMDPARATLDQAWIWRNAGPYFGVPLMNYAGWYLCVFTILLSFSIYIHRGRATHESQNGNLVPWLQAVAMYGAIGFDIIVSAITSVDRPVSTVDGRVWHSADTNQSMALVCTFTMIFVAVLSCALLAQTRCGEASETARN
jgi:putative membrane protein